jgi:hypothetical protein
MRLGIINRIVQIAFKHLAKRGFVMNKRYVVGLIVCLLLAGCDPMPAQWKNVHTALVAGDCNTATPLLEQVINGLSHNNTYYKQGKERLEECEHLIAARRGVEKGDLLRAMEEYAVLARLINTNEVLHPVLLQDVQVLYKTQAVDTLLIQPLESGRMSYSTKYQELYQADLITDEQYTSSLLRASDLLIEYAVDWPYSQLTPANLMDIYKKLESRITADELDALKAGHLTQLAADMTHIIQDDLEQGSPHTAESVLQSILQLEPDDDARASIEKELVRVQYLVMISDIEWARTNARTTHHRHSLFRAIIVKLEQYIEDHPDHPLVSDAQSTIKLLQEEISTASTAPIPTLRPSLVTTTDTVMVQFRNPTHHQVSVTLDGGIAGETYSVTIPPCTKCAGRSSTCDVNSSAASVQVKRGVYTITPQAIGFENPAGGEITPIMRDETLCVTFMSLPGQ